MNCKFCPNFLSKFLGLFCVYVSTQTQDKEKYGVGHWTVMIGHWCWCLVVEPLLVMEAFMLVLVVKLVMEVLVVKLVVKKLVVKLVVLLLVLVPMVASTNVKRK